MAATPTLDGLHSLYWTLLSTINSFEERLHALDGQGTDPPQPSIWIRKAAATAPPPTSKASASFAKPTSSSSKKQVSKAAPKSKPSPPSKPSKTIVATQSQSIPPLQPARTIPREGQADLHHVNLAIPQDLVSHVVGQGGRGLKQLNDFTGARVTVYQTVHNSTERHVTIRGTVEQLGDALVVLGKRIARKRVRPPKAKKVESTAQPATPSLRPNPR